MVVAAGVTSALILEMQSGNLVRHAIFYIIVPISVACVARAMRTSA